MNQIKFQHNYPKIRKQTKAVLLDVELTTFQALNPEFIVYDTIFLVADQPDHYPLSKGLLLVLTFKGDKRIPFTTIRRATGTKESYYRSKIGQEFNIVIEKQESEQMVMPMETPLGENIDSGGENAAD